MTKRTIETETKIGATGRERALILVAAEHKRRELEAENKCPMKMTPVWNGDTVVLTYWTYSDLKSVAS